jgi:hypothetical protein
MTLYTVSLTGGSAPYEVYGGITACDDYLLGRSGAGAAAYRALVVGSDDRDRLLVDATRYIDRQRWKGTANADGGTTLAFPRDDLEDLDSTEATNAEQLALVEQAVFEMVAVIAADEEASSAADQGSNIAEMGAGSARLKFFSPTSPGRGTATKLPTAVHDLIGHWLAGAGSGASVSVAGAATGTCGNSYFDACDGYKRSGAF